jgi:cellulose synthase/poly-beta-1,6-N-acetylglucosamine synthase-like glycosyltransferase
MNDVASALLWLWSYVSFAYLFGVNASYVVLSTLGFLMVRKHAQQSRMFDDQVMFRSAAMLKPITILAPAYNEELTAVDSIRSLLNISYPSFEVILVNDGSTDRTLAVLRKAYALEETLRVPAGNLATQPVRGVYRSARHPNLLVVDKENGGKFDALNAGINYSRNPLFLSIDADSLIERTVLLKMVRPFLERPETVAVGGIVRAINSCEVRDGRVVRVHLPRNPLVVYQVIEYLRSFLFGRSGWAWMNMLVVISGAFGLFHRQSVIDAGGYRKTVGEDMELVLRLHRHFLEVRRPYRVAFLAEPVCWTEVPDSLRSLGRQRNRWSRGLLETLWIHRAMFLNPRYGRIGLFAVPYFLLAEGLGVFVEILGIPVVLAAWYQGQLDHAFLAAFLVVSLLFGSLISFSAVVVEELVFRHYPRFTQVLVLALYSLVEGISFHQLAMWWRAKGVVDFLRGEQGWGRIARIGFAKPRENRPPTSRETGA